MRLGADPELFLLDVSGKLSSVIGKIGGTKFAPLQIIDLPQGYTLQEDNVALELGIPPCSSPEEYIMALQTCMNKGLEYLPGYSYSKVSSASFPKEELEHPLANIFGCEPDYNAWTGEENPRPVVRNRRLRSAGGHVHVETDVPWQDMGKALDFYLSIPSVVMDNTVEAIARRKLYGRAGACRPKPYGVEHRVLSNFWVFSERTINWVFNSAVKAEAAVKAGKLPVIESLGEEIQNIINTSDVEAALNMCNTHNLQIV